MARTKKAFLFRGTLDGTPPAIREFNLVGGTAYHEGAVLRCSMTSGSAKKLSAATQTAVLGVLTSYVSSASAATTKVGVYLADSKNIFQARMYGTSTPRNRMYDELTIAISTTHNYTVAQTAGVAHCRVIGFDPDEPAATAATGVEYWVVFEQATSLLGEASSAS